MFTNYFWDAHAFLKSFHDFVTHFTSCFVCSVTWLPLTLDGKCCWYQPNDMFGAVCESQYLNTSYCSSAESLWDRSFSDILTPHHSGMCIDMCRCKFYAQILLWSFMILFSVRCLVFSCPPKVMTKVSPPIPLGSCSLQHLCISFMTFSSSFHTCTCCVVGRVWYLVV